jgi:hypothetical protein
MRSTATKPIGNFLRELSPVQALGCTRVGAAVVDMGCSAVSFLLETVGTAVFVEKKLRVCKAQVFVPPLVV